MIKVLVVDDSALVRQMLTQILMEHEDILVVGSAGDPYQARNKIKQLKPDVITLDIEMPRMDGLTFLSNLIRLHPLPVVMVSSLTKRGAESTLEAMSIGAIDFVEKPTFDLEEGLLRYASEIQSKVIAASQTTASVLQERSNAEARRVEKAKQPTDSQNNNQASNEPEKKYLIDEVLEKKKSVHYETASKVVAVGASTGGTVALEDVLTKLPIESPGIVVALHIPEKFSGSFAKRLDNLCSIRVLEAIDGTPIMKGHCYIAPGGKHILVERVLSQYVIRISDDKPVNRHKPSVDVLFRSVSQSCGPNSLGIMLTGMGDDGARGMLEMMNSGAYTLAQDKESSVVWGMPGSAYKLGGVKKIASLDLISELIPTHFKKVT